MSLPSIPSMPTSASDAQAQGESVFGQASDAASNAVGSLDGDSSSAYAGIAAAATGIVSDLPKGQMTDLISDAVSVGTAALKTGAAGAGIGTAIFPGVGTAIGGEVGAIVGGGMQAIKEVWPIIQRDHFNPIKIVGDIASMVVGIFDPKKPPQGDYRYLSEKYCFPATMGKTMVVIPGSEKYNPRFGAHSTFYQTPAGGNAAWSLAYTFAVEWSRPPIGTYATAQTATLAWGLARFWMQTYSDRLKHKGTDDIAWKTLVVSFGTEAKAKRALSKLCAWYGQPSHFPTLRPYPSTMGKPPGNSSVAHMLKEFNACTMDGSYYAIANMWNDSAQQIAQCAPSAATTVMLTPDTSLVAVAEMAVCDMSNAAVLQWAVKEQNAFLEGRKVDAKVYKGMEVKPHPTFSRVIGNTAALVKADAKNGVLGPTLAAKVPPSAVSPQAPGKPSKGAKGATSYPSAHTTSGQTAGYTSPENNSTNPLPSDSGSGMLLAGGVLVGAGLLYAFTRK